MLPFDFQPRTRIVFGPDTVDQLGALAAQVGGRRALMVSDPGIVATGHPERGRAALAQAGIETLLFDGVGENPTTEHVAACVAVARQFEPDMLIGFGGGSSMDCAKGTNFIYTNGGRMEDYWGTGKATKAMLPMIAVPTTAGTGSEMQSYALISTAEGHVKMACGDKKATCRVAVLDPKLTLTQPPLVTALTGIDAIAHALETYVTRVRNSLSLALSREAWRLLEENFARVLDEPDDLPARGGMQLGAGLAGLAIENSMLGAAHALANPLTARYSIVHGQAVGMMLPHVIRFNGLEFNGSYQELLKGTSDLTDAPPAAHGAEGLADYITGLVDKAGLPTTLSRCNVSGDVLPQMAAEAARQWTGTFNPRPVTEVELLQLYEAAY